MERTQISSEKKLTVLLLCWFFGLFAVHRFYTGKYLAGGLQLLIIALGIVLILFKAETIPSLGGLALALWWIIDVARIIMGKYTDKEGKPIIDWV